MATNVAGKNSSVFADCGIDPKNTGSTEYQIVALTNKINYLSAHVKKHTKDHASRRGLLVLINLRKSLMAYLQSVDHVSLSKLTQKLDIRNTAN